MNYRHIYHAGNFADVFKHIILSRIIEYLKRKEQAFRIIDTHAGIGLYDLSSSEAQKTGEWLAGVGKFLLQGLDKFSAEQLEILKPWLNSILSLNPDFEEDHKIKFYPGSPFIACSLLRKQDRLSLIELHTEDHKQLLKHFGGNYKIKIFHLNGWHALKGHLPPKEKRGLIFIDPPFEERNDFSKIIEHLEIAYKRFSGATYAIWHPIKNKKITNGFHESIKNTKIKNILILNFFIDYENIEEKMAGCAMCIVNPPYILEEEFDKISPLFLKYLASEKGKITKEWIRKS